jgi:hypothetical protein
MLEYISVRMLQIAECSIRISDKMHRSNIVSYPVKCKQKYAIDGLISRSTRTLNIPAEVPVFHTGCILSRSYHDIF